MARRPSTSALCQQPADFDFVKLDDGETLVAKSAGQSKTLAQREVLNTVVHRAELDGDGEGTIFEVAFDRDVDAGAPRSLAILPAKFELVAPPTTMSRAAALTFAWSPSGSADGMSLTASGDCIENYTAAITGDPGTVTVDANSEEADGDDHRGRVPGHVRAPACEARHPRRALPHGRHPWHAGPHRDGHLDAVGRCARI